MPNQGQKMTSSITWNKEGESMGLFFEIQCVKCGYKETLYDGELGQEHLDEMRIKREFESGEGDLFYRNIFELMRSTVTKEDSIGKIYDFEKIEPGSDEWEKHRLLYGEPYIQLTPTIYECYECKRFFNHDRMRIICKRGIFKENDVECSTCRSRNTRSLSADDFFEDEGEPKTEESYSYICKERCPKCVGKLKVIDSGFADM